LVPLIRKGDLVHFTKAVGVFVHFRAASGGVCRGFTVEDIWQSIV
jgi:hypothetical protein